ncbi:ATP-dependent DNA helicase PIF1-like protein [Tanacetum coccineum]
MMNDDDENGYGDPNHVDAHVDSSASKRRQYNKQYYASRKDVVVSQSVAEKRKIANKKYYERQKEIKKRILANGEGSSHSILATNNTEVNMPEINIEASYGIIKLSQSQGQTIPNVGVYLPNSVFSHGQLYVALSRGISRETTKVLVRPTKQFRHDGVYTSNVVYKEVLNDK